MNLLVLFCVSCLANANDSGLSVRERAHKLLETGVLQSSNLHPIKRVREAESKDPFDYFDSSLGAIVESYPEVMKNYGSLDVSPPTKKETCLGFDHFSENGSYIPVRCVPDAKVVPFVEGMFADLSWAFNSSSEMAGIMVQMKYCTGGNWTMSRLAYASSNTSSPKFAHVFKNYDDSRKCSNWVIQEIGVEFQLVPDMLNWCDSQSHLGECGHSEMRPNKLLCVLDPYRWDVHFGGLQSAVHSTPDPPG
jgi:hypothetical protein